MVDIILNERFLLGFIDYSQTASSYIMGNWIILIYANILLVSSSLNSTTININLNVTKMLVTRACDLVPILRTNVCISY